MKRTLIPLLSLLLFMSTSCQSKAQNTEEEKSKPTVYTLETSMGNIQVKLYDNTPLHKAHFEKMVNEHTYDSVLFHRVINKFMIQTGDPETKPGDKSMKENPDDLYGLVPAEFRAENFHKKGALAAARMADQVNPEKMSSSTQFYLVQGRVYDEQELQMMEMYYGKSFSPQQREIYKTIGGTPFLDGDYTVYGEIISGLDIVDKIAATPTRPGDRPIEDIYLIRVTKN